MAEQRRSSREIEREVEHQRAELRDTVEELFNRFTFDEAWIRLGAYMRDNRRDFGHSLERVVKEKPLAVALTAVGVGWLLFGPPQRRPPRAAAFDRRTSPLRDGRDDHARTREMLEDADFMDRSARGPSAPDATPDPWEAPSRTPTAASQPASAGTASTGASAGASGLEPSPRTPMGGTAAP